MRVHFTTVVRKVPADQGGAYRCADLSTRTLLHETPVRPSDPDVHHANPRGGARGGRGVIIRPDEVIVASYHTLLRFDRDFNHIGRIDNNLFVGLHETSPENDTIWVTSTAIDAALCIDNQGSIVDAFWPREIPSLQKKLNLEPKNVDRSIDNRVLWLDDKTGKDASHTHLNAVCCHDGEIYLLLNRFGTVWAMREDRPVIEDPQLDAPHNLVPFRDHWLINNSRNHSIMIYDAAGQRERAIDLLSFPEIASILESASGQDVTAKAFFVRGLNVTPDGKIVVGFSPGTLATFDFETGALLDLFQFANDVRVCVHGLEIESD